MYNHHEIAYVKTALRERPYDWQSKIAVQTQF